MSYRLGMVNGAWRVDQADKDHSQKFPRPEPAEDMLADRMFEDCYSPELEYILNDSSYERNTLMRPNTHNRVVVCTDERVMRIDCKL